MGAWGLGHQGKERGEDSGWGEACPGWGQGRDHTARQGERLGLGPKEKWSGRGRGSWCWTRRGERLGCGKPGCGPR